MLFKPTITIKLNLLLLYDMKRLVCKVGNTESQENEGFNYTFAHPTLIGILFDRNDLIRLSKV